MGGRPFSARYPLMAFARSSARALIAGGAGGGGVVGCGAGAGGCGPGCGDGAGGAPPFRRLPSIVSHGLYAGCDGEDGCDGGDGGA